MRIAKKQFILIALIAVFTPLTPAQAQNYKLDRTRLPIAEPDYPHSTVLDARDAKAPPRFEKILKITVDVKPIGAAIKAEADLAQRTAAVKKALSDLAILKHAGCSQGAARDVSLCAEEFESST